MALRGDFTRPERREAFQGLLDGGVGEEEAVTPMPGLEETGGGAEVLLGAGLPERGVLLAIESRPGRTLAPPRRPRSRAVARLSAGDVQGFVDGLAPDDVRHCQAMPAGLQEIRGRDVMRDWLLSNQASFPDWREEIEALLGEGDFVARRSRGTGTMEGPLGPFPPTHRRMEVVIIGMHGFEDVSSRRPGPRGTTSRR